MRILRKCFATLAVLVLCMMTLSGCQEGSEAESFFAETAEKALKERDAAENETESAIRDIGEMSSGVDVQEVKEIAVDSPDGGKLAQQLPPPDDMDYHLELLRLPKWEWKDLGDGKVEYRGKTYKRNTYMKAILGLGVDTHKSLDGDYELEDRGVCDGIFLVAQDSARNSIKVLMIPRDTITEIMSYDRDGNYLGEVLNHIALAYSQRPNALEGSQNMVQAVSSFLCGLEINHYATVNLDVLAGVNDRVGGVTVTIPNDELQQKYPEWTKGKTVQLHGDDAEAFLRYRNWTNPEVDDTPIRRMSQHKEYISGFYDALKKTSRINPNIINDLYDEVEANMLTDMSKGEILKLGADCIECNFSSEDILMVPGEEENRNYTEYYADYEKLIPMILELFYREI